MKLPNGTTISSIGTGFLHGLGAPVPAHIFNDCDLQQSLLSLSDLCKQGCTITLTDKALTISTNNRPSLSFPKDPRASLWSIPFAEQTINQNLIPHLASNVIHHQLDADFVAFWHAALGSPPVETLLYALRRGYLQSIPRLNTKMVYDNKPQSIATSKGHLDLQRSGIKSTKPTSSRKTIVKQSINNLREDDQILDSDKKEEDNLMYCRTTNLEDAINEDATGRFPHISARGHQYILITVYHGYIHAELMLSRTSTSYIRAYTASVEFFRSRGHIVKYIKLDNETSTALLDYFTTTKISVERVPPNNHRTNRAERAIRSFKNHFISTLCSAHPTFPMAQWDLLIPQTPITLNLLRAYRINPNISAYHGIYGKSFDFLAHPIAPCRTSVLVHNTPANRKSFDPHGVTGFYLGPTLVSTAASKSTSYPPMQLAFLIH